MSPVKEPRYYCEAEYAEWGVPMGTREEYEQLFDGVRSQKAIGEASPQYLNSPTAADRIARDLPGVKLIVSLRNPADRAYSSYLGRLRSGIDRSGVEEALQPGTYYFETSLYHPRLSRYFERFERSRIKVILFDDLASNTAAVVRELHEFLEIDTTFVTDVTKRHNAAQSPRSIILTPVCRRALINSCYDVQTRFRQTCDGVSSSGFATTS